MYVRGTAVSSARSCDFVLRSTSLESDLQRMLEQLEARGMAGAHGLADEPSTADGTRSSANISEVGAASGAGEQGGGSFLQTIRKGAEQLALAGLSHENADHACGLGVESLDRYSLELIHQVYAGDYLDFGFEQ